MNIADFAERGNPEDMPEYTGANESKIGAKSGHVSWFRGESKKALIVSVVVLSATASLGLGILAGEEVWGQGSGGAGLVISSTPLTHPKSSDLSANALSTLSSVGSTVTSSSIPSGGEVVGNTSTREYYLPWCKQVGKIASSSVKWFASESEATSSGYTAGKACAGI